MAAKIQQRNEVVNKQCVEVQVNLAVDCFKSCILKGQGVGAIYGDLAMLRQSGDSDVWVPNGMSESMVWIAKNYGEVRYDYINAHVPMYADTEVELHWRCQSMNNLFLNSRLQHLLDTQHEALTTSKILLNNGQTIIVPTDEFNLFYILLHAFNHMFSEGLGLRQLMDYYSF